MKEKDRIALTKEKREEMVAAIKAYYLKDREEEIGQLAAGMLLDFVIDELAPEFYNQGVVDSCKYMSERIEDMQSLLL
jgi:uncharacterized protein (DUF2164 family)